MPTTQPTLNLLEKLASSSIATGAVYDPASTYVGLYTAAVLNGLNTVMANLTEAAYTGYARKLASPWAGPYQLLSGGIFYQGSLLKFVGPSDATGQTVSGFFLADAATSGNLLYYVSFTTPIGLLTALDALDLVVRVNQDPLATFDVSIIANG